MRGYTCDWCKEPGESTSNQYQQEEKPAGWNEIEIGQGAGTRYEDVCKTCIDKARTSLKK